jgi:integrase
MQTVIRRPLLILAEFYESGNYCKTHQRGSTTDIPPAFEDVFLICRDYINDLDVCLKSKKRKLWIIANYLVFLQSEGKTSLSETCAGDASRYLVSLGQYAHATKRLIAGNLREILNLMHEKGMTSFSGHDAFPLIRKSPKSAILSCYTKEEIATVLASIDDAGISGKTARFIISFTAFLGIRAGDLINLKFSNIDWANNSINIIQQKTGMPLTLAMPDEVKFPLLDYLKNARHGSDDKDYVLITSYAPYTRLHNVSSIHRAVSKSIERSGIRVDGRRRGPHAMRHSLATNLLKENVPLSAISNILGHSSTKTTERYIGADETNLKELSLEVEDVL